MDFVTDEDVSSRHGECGCSGEMARFWIVLPGVEGRFGWIRQTMREDQTLYAVDDAGAP